MRYRYVVHLLHSWKGENSKPLENIYSKLVDSDTEFVKHPRECLDFICVSDLAVWESYKEPMKTVHFEKNGKRYYDYVPGVLTGYGQTDINFNAGNSFKEKFTPIGTFLSGLMQKLAINDKRLKNFSSYFAQTIGGGASIIWRKWEPEILSENARIDLKKNEQHYRKYYFNINHL